MDDLGIRKLSKHAINAWLANWIVFINELSNVEKFECNINDVSEALKKIEELDMKHI